MLKNSSQFHQSFSFCCYLVSVSFISALMFMVSFLLLTRFCLCVFLVTLVCRFVCLLRDFFCFLKQTYIVINISQNCFCCLHRFLDHCVFICLHVFLNFLFDFHPLFVEQHIVQPPCCGFCFFSCNTNFQSHSTGQKRCLI